MIAYLQGNIKQINGSHLIVVNSGVGYGVVVPRTDAEPLQLNQSIELFVYEHIQERAHDLYGFMSSDGQSLFEQLLTINGIGPKAALAILDLGPISSIENAIASSNTAYIAGAKGVGKKSAERVIVELKDKMRVDVLLKKSDATVVDANTDDALEALIGLGYSQAQVVDALSKINEEGTEARIRAALKELS